MTQIQERKKRKCTIWPLIIFSFFFLLTLAVMAAQHPRRFVINVPHLLEIGCKH